MPAEPDRTPAVFVSYVQADKAWADWIAEALNESGRSVVTGEDVVPTGEVIETAVKTAITEADEVLVVLSGRAAASPWVRAEIALARAVGRPITAALVDQAAASVTGLDDIKTVDLVGASLDEARGRVVAAMSGQRIEVEPRPSPLLVDLPATFVDRPHEMQQLERAFLARAEGDRATVVLTGPPGIGKTALATMFVRRHESEFAIVHWIRASDRAHESLPPVPEGGRALLVIDDADSYESIVDLLAAALQWHVLVISRAGRWGRPFEVVSLAPFDHVAAVELLSRVLPEARSEDVARIARIASGYPVALRMAAEVARTRSAAGFLADFETFESALGAALRERRGYYFLDTDDPRAISEFERGLEDVLGAGEAGVDLHDRKSGSWRGWWRRRYSPDRVDVLADRAERAAEVAALAKPEGEANRNNAEALARLLEASAAIPNLVVISGSVLLIKVTDTNGPRVVSKTLTATELRRFEEREELLSDPARALAFLQSDHPDPGLPAA